MKKFLTVVVVLTVGFNSVVNANEIDKPKSPVGVAVVNTGSVFKLFYRGTKSDNVTVTIYNAQNEKVYREKLSHIVNFVRPYNFSSLPEGSYQIVLEGADGKQVQNVVYKRHNNAKLMDLMRVAGSPGKYVLRISNKGPESLQVKIYDKSQSLVYEGKENIEGDFAKVYDLSDIGNDFFVEVTDKSGNTQSLSL
jgi:hypothetical protein